MESMTKSATGTFAIPGEGRVAPEEPHRASGRQRVSYAAKCEERPEFLEGLVLRAQVEQVADLGGLAGKAARVAIRDPDQVLRIAEGQRTQQQRVDDTEDGRAARDAETDDQDGEAGETGLAAIGSEAIADVLQDAGQDGAAERRSLHERYTAGRRNGYAEAPFRQQPWSGSE